VVAVLAPESTEASDLQVRRVFSRDDRRAFLELPWLIYADDPQWRAPMRRSLRRRLDPATNPFHAEAEVDHFVAYSQGAGATQTPVGRISVTVDHAYVARFGRYGFFGFFESIDDQRVATALLRTAERWAAERDMVMLSGPYSYSPRDEMGLLVEGFDHPPTVLQPHNPPYYARLLRDAGYRPRFDTTCYRWCRGRDDANADRLRRRGAKVLQDSRIQVRRADMTKYSAELELLRTIYNDSFHDHPEHVPVSRTAFAAMADELKAILDPDLVRIVEADHTPVGFLMLIPDINEVLPRSGRLNVALLSRLLFKRRGRIRGVDTAVVVMIGAVQALFGEGLGRVIAGEMADVIAASRYRQVATTWIHQDNPWSSALVAQMQTPPAKRYRVFEKALM
jgi:hypothetical protein